MASIRSDNLPSSLLAQHQASSVANIHDRPFATPLRAASPEPTMTANVNRTALHPTGVEYAADEETWWRMFADEPV